MLEKHLINIAPAPVLSRLKGLDNGMARRVEALRHVLVLGAITAAHVAAAHPLSEMGPRYLPSADTPRSPRHWV